MEYKACNYLLKPAKIEEIVQVMCELRDELLREEKRTQEEARLREKLEKSIPVLREHYMNQLPEGFERDE